MTSGERNIPCGGAPVPGAASGTPQQRPRIPLRKITVTAVAMWTLVAVGVYVWEVIDNDRFVKANARAIAWASFERDLSFRRWAARHGGVYVPVTAETPPNRHLNVPERDITTPSGKALTLMNPAYMTRQVYEISKMHPDVPQGHITSLKPIRPENAPDAWERKALEAFEKGLSEFSEYQDINGKKHFRFMRALTAEKPCLKCHAAQGYHEGDVRGGISVSLSVAELHKITQLSNSNHLLIVTVVWVLGIAGIWFGVRRIGEGARALSESEERYRQQFQQSRAVMLIIDPENGAIVDANPAACSFYRYDCVTLKSLTLSGINTSPPEELSRMIAGVKDNSKGPFITRHRLSDGTVLDVEVFSNPVTFHGRTLLHSIIVDITGRLAAERELQDKTDFAENLVLNSTTPIFVLDSGHQVLIWNRALEELTGIRREEMVGTCEPWRAFYPAARPCLADIVLDGAFDGAAELYSHLSRSRLLPGGLHAEGDFSFNGRAARLVFSAAPIHDRDGRVIAAIETLEDITDRISLEAQLLHAQKMETVGVMAGGIAHDFNNILTVINGYATLLQSTLAGDEENRMFAAEITASVERATEITRSLLAFSGKHEIQMQFDDINRIIAALRKSLRRLIREDITLTIHEDATRLPVNVDRVQIEQVVINLVLNACDAAEAGGTITVSTDLVHLAEAAGDGNTVIPAGDFARITITDNGTGMDTATLVHIFEPFYTTKSKGKGTGLGLAIVHSIITRHGGHISVTSAPGSGTEFRVYLPQYDGTAFMEGRGTAEPVGCRGTETILVVEDDVSIMKLLRASLGRYGYTILCAADGVEAVEIFDRYRDEIGIAIVDVIMPRMNGREAVERIRCLRPELPIIMTSGYTDEIIDRGDIDTLNVTFLQKPVKPLEMLAAIRAALDTACRTLHQEEKQK